MEATRIRSGRRAWRASAVVLVAFLAASPAPAADPVPAAAVLHFSWDQFPGYLPPVGNQGSTSSCVGWAMGYCAKTFFEKRYRHPDWDVSLRSNQVSPSWVYNIACGLGTEERPSPKSALCVFYKHGFATREEMPFTCDEGRMPNDCVVCAAAARKHHILPQAFTQTKMTAGDFSEVTKYLRSTGPVVFVLKTTRDFYERHGGDATWSLVVADLDSAPKHAIACVGFDAERVIGGDPPGALRFRNSLGTCWHDHGSVWISYDDVKRMVDQAWGLEKRAPLEFGDWPYPSSDCPCPVVRGDSPWSEPWERPCIWGGPWCSFPPFWWLAPAFVGGQVQLRAPDYPAVPHFLGAWAEAELNAESRRWLEPAGSTLDLSVIGAWRHVLTFRLRGLPAEGEEARFDLPIKVMLPSKSEYTRITYRFTLSPPGK